jgi:undecaprenyl diphosphate synthase
MTDTITLPTHLGIILDGNRRWAKQQGLPTLQGHRQGMDNFKDVSLAAFDRGIQYVSAYIFSTENWQRSQEEVSYLMSLISKGIQKHLATFHAANIKLVMLGSRQGIDAKILKSIDQAVIQTEQNLKGTLALCFNYSGQQEITEAAQKLAKTGQEITVKSLDEAIQANDIPPLDLIIRTSGERRLSGFMLWRAAYSELYFTDTMWPDFRPLDLDLALADYAQRQRRFGS